MGKAARAIIIEDDRMLIMHRNKEGSQYYTLVGGRAADGEDAEAAVIREVREETGLEVTSAKCVFYEKHAPPYDEQYIFLCEVAPHDDIKIQDTSEEAWLNRVGINLHTPVWASLRTFGSLPFRTPQLQEAIIKGLKKGFPSEPQAL